MDDGLYQYGLIFLPTDSDSDAPLIKEDQHNADSLLLY